MRLVGLELAGFRGFSRKQSFDLDADAVVVIGANGTGKTSLFDGVLWALTGRVPRLGEANDTVLSRYSETGETHARLIVRLADRSECSIRRVFDGRETRLSVAVDGNVLEGPSAAGKLIDLVWKDAASSSDSQAALASVITRNVYLQQDLVRQFVEAASAEERFTAVSELIGAGRVADLQLQLERAKAAWSKATNAQEEDLQPQKKQLASMEARLGEIVARRSDMQSEEVNSRWTSWWESLERHGMQVTRPLFGSQEASAALDAAIQEIDPRRRSGERRLHTLTALLADIEAAAGRPAIDLGPLRQKLEALENQLNVLRARVDAEQARVAEIRRLQAALQESSEQLRAMAELALKHLGDRCPVCDQAYDQASTRQRLERLANSRPQQASPAGASDALPELLEALASKEAELSSAQLAVRSAEHADRDARAIDESTRRRFDELGLEIANVRDRHSLLRQGMASAQSEIASLAALAREGEALALLVAQASDQARVLELQREIETLRRAVAEQGDRIKGRRATGELGQKVIEALRQATSDVVSRRLNDVTPLLRMLYSRIDPHPAFRVVSFLTDVVRGRGQLFTVVHDPETEIQVRTPQVVLSSSQLNALAVSVFLALNLSASRPPLSAALLDDPLQSLDDINLLALVDLLRRTKDGRQLCVSTHNARLGQLLARKLRPGRPDQRTVMIELNGWVREGPLVTARDVERDPAQIRLAAG